MKIFVNTYQRYRYSSTRVGGKQVHGLRLSYRPAAGAMVNGNLAMVVSADLDSDFDPTTDIISYIEGSEVKRIFRVDRPTSLVVPVDMLKGTTRDGWFYTSDSSSRPLSQQFPCRVLLFQMTDITTPADASAVQTMTVIGDIKAEWCVETHYQKPLPKLLTPPESGLGSDPTEPVASVSNPDSLSYSTTTKTFHAPGSGQGGASTITPIIFSLAHYDYDLPSNINPPPHHAPILAVDVFSLQRADDWMVAESNTENLFSNSVWMENGERRDLVDWIINKVSEVGSYIASSNVSIWSVVRDAGVLLARHLFFRDPASMNLQNFLKRAILDRAEAGDSTCQLWAEAYGEAVSHGIDGIAYRVLGYIRTDVTAVEAQETLRQLTATQPVTVSKWIAPASSSQSVFYPKTTDPPDHAVFKGGSSPSYSADSMALDHSMATWALCGEILTNWGGPTADCNFEMAPYFGPTRFNTFDLSVAPVILDTVQIETIDLSSGYFFYMTVLPEVIVPDTFPAPYVAAYPDTSIPGTPSMVTWAKAQADDGVSGYSIISNHRANLTCIANSGSPKLMQAVTSVDVTGGITVAINSDVWPGYASTRYIGTGCVMAIPSLGRLVYPTAKTTTPSTAARRLLDVTSHAASSSSARMTSTSRHPTSRK
jgi:hypothetical protein